ncbi:hypothetical protein GCM10022251_59000 [Phytohabitans flavus]|uniref:Uncharacterized protein n=1 Tax=Phytohabitans flavus TaxID=1076124 RepID=A0A6F8XXJ0_9ACTN|nr:hypothetical protein [Phytohabitans flavus]BCB78556.1 hypothetical protein Pflav_049660 [Phytohabitans flavus]
MQGALFALAFIAFCVLYLFLTFLIAIPYTGWAFVFGLAAGLLLVTFHAWLVLASHASSPLQRPADGYLGPRPGQSRRDLHDFAWPQYFVHQVWLDLFAIMNRANGDTLWLWRAAWRRIPPLRLPHQLVYRSRDGGADHVDRPLVALLGLPVLAIPGGFLVGLTLGGLFALVLLLAGGAFVTAFAWALGWLAIAVQRAAERWWRWAKRSTPCCAHCFFPAELPVYQCPNEHDATLPRQSDRHRDLRPGRLGVVYRRCGCDTRLPASRIRAGRTLRARCPKCDAPLPDGAGWATELRIGVFGAAGAGKTRLVEAAVRDLTMSKGGATVDHVTGNGGTPGVGSARATTLRIKRWRRPTLVHIFDAPGAALVDPARNSRYHYFDVAAGLLFVLDACSITQVRAQHATAPGHLTTGDRIASHDPEDSYQALVTALQRRGVETGGQRLAFVLTKGDLVAMLPAGQDLEPNSRSIRDWLRAQGLDNLVLSAERDFRTVRYFLGRAATTDESEVAAPLRWLLAREGVAL